MDKEQLLAYLTEGLDDAGKKYVTDALANEKIASKLTGLRQNKDFDALQAQRDALNAELEGGPKEPGAKAYKKWYADNQKAIEKLQADNAKYAERYGTLEAPNPNPNPNPQPVTFTKEDIQRQVDERFQQQFAPNIAGTVKGLGRVIQKHLRAGRKEDLDIDKLEAIMTEKKLNIDQAYDEYDKPERDIAAKAAEDARVDQRVKDELQKRGGSTYFPSGADMTPGSLSRDRTAPEKFDQAALDRDLVSTYLKAGTKSGLESLN